MKGTVGLLYRLYGDAGSRTVGRPSSFQGLKGLERVLTATKTRAMQSNLQNSPADIIPIFVKVLPDKDREKLWNCILKI